MAISGGSVSRRRKLKSAARPPVTDLGAAWLSAVDALAALTPIFEDVDGAQACIGACLRSGTLRAFPIELRIVKADDWGDNAKENLNRAKKLGFVHGSWLGPFPDSIALTSNFWRQSPNSILDMPLWDWVGGNFIAGLSVFGPENRDYYWIACSVVFNTFEIDCLCERQRLQRQVTILGAESLKKGGRPLDAKWSDWVAEWVWYCQENGIEIDREAPEIATKLDDFLAKRGKGKIDRRSVNGAIEATLDYAREKMGKPQK